MPEQRINQLNTKFATMQEKVENLVCQNTKEHDAIFGKLDEISHLLNAQNVDTERRVRNYYKSFATKEENLALAKRVDRQERLYWVALGIFSIITLLLNLFGRTIVENVFNK